jgi:hypothetical protein
MSHEIRGLFNSGEDARTVAEALTQAGFPLFTITCVGDKNRAECEETDLLHGEPVLIVIDAEDIDMREKIVGVLIQNGAIKIDGAAPTFTTNPVNSRKNTLPRSATDEESTSGVL